MSDLTGNLTGKNPGPEDKKSNNIKLNIPDLVELQLLEKEILKKAIEISALKKDKEIAKLQFQLDEMNAGYEVLSNQYNLLEHDRKKIEDTISTQNEKIRKNEEKLFSGTITSSKELVNYQEEIKQFKNVNDELESKELELMFSIDELRPKLKNTEEKKNALLNEATELKKKVEEKIKDIESKIDKLKELRNKAILKISKDLLVAYNEMKQKKGGIALAIMKDNVCDVCNMKLPVGDIARIKDPDKIHKCPTCGRMLVICTEEIEARKESIKNLI